MIRIYGIGFLGSALKCIGVEFFIGTEVVIGKGNLTVFRKGFVNDINIIKELFILRCIVGQDVRQLLPVVDLDLRQ